jgi:hypothetical protein
VTSRSFASCWLAFAVVACAREQPSETKTKPRPASTAKATSAAPNVVTPAAELKKLGPVLPEAEQHRPPPPTKPLKAVGAIGEELEGDVSYFKLLSIKPCKDPNVPAAGSGGAPNPAARNVVAAEVEIVAKTKLTVNPRDVVLGKGGITFNASLDPKRELAGCTPLLKLSWLQARDSVKGYVLFDLPTWGPGSNLNELNLVYHPARFGGSAQVHVKLAGGQP